jgi:hypothetical protein
MKQWVIDRTLERARRKLAHVEALAALHRQINDIDSKLRMLANIKALYPVEVNNERVQS